MEADVFLQILKVYSIHSYFQSSKIGDLCFMKCPSERLPTFAIILEFTKPHIAQGISFFIAFHFVHFMGYSIKHKPLISEECSLSFQQSCTYVQHHLFLSPRTITFGSQEFPFQKSECMYVVHILHNILITYT